MAVDILLQNGIDKKVHYCTTLHYRLPYNARGSKFNGHQPHSKELTVKVGYSDHTLGIAVATAAVALGATVIGCSLDKTLPGPDHQTSLEPRELEQMIYQIREVSKAIQGDGKKSLRQGN